MMQLIFLLFICQISSAETGKVLSFETKLTGYYPENSRMEGGFKDRYGHDLKTLQDFLEGKASYVSVAMDYKGKMNKYMKTYFCIPALDKSFSKAMSGKIKKKYHGHILFKAVDTGSAFYFKKWKKMDICVKDKKASYDERVNTKASILDCNRLAKSILK